MEEEGEPSGLRGRVRTESLGRPVLGRAFPGGDLPSAGNGKQRAEGPRRRGSDASHVLLAVRRRRNVGRCPAACCLRWFGTRHPGSSGPGLEARHAGSIREEAGRPPPKRGRFLLGVRGARQLSWAGRLRHPRIQLPHLCGRQGPRPAHLHEERGAALHHPPRRAVRVAVQAGPPRRGRSRRPILPRPANSACGRQPRPHSHRPRRHRRRRNLLGNTGRGLPGPDVTLPPQHLDLLRIRQLQVRPRPRLRLRQGARQR